MKTRRSIRLPAWYAAASILVALLPFGGTAEATNAMPAWRPERLTHLGNSDQVLVVSATSWNTTFAVARLFVRIGGRWQQEMAPVPARLGWGGLVLGSQRLQDTGTTPAGTFPLMGAFGFLPAPGGHFPYRRVTSGSWWPNDPADPSTYNVWQSSRPAKATWRASWGEQLIKWLPQYDYGLVLGYNLPAGQYVSRGGETVTLHPANLRAGGGIFVHVSSTGPTAGCVSLPAPALAEVIRLLVPADHPLIVIGPMSGLDRL